MSGLSDKMVDLITGGRGAPVMGSFRDMATALRAQPGGLNRAARLAGVDRRTYQRWFQRWNEGKEPRPRPGTLEKLAEGVRRGQLAASIPRESDVRLTVTDRGRDRQAGRERVLTGDGNLKLSAGTMDRVAEAWVKTGQPEAAAAAFLAGITVPFYKRWLTPPSTARERQAETHGGGGGGASGADDDDDDDDEFDDFDSWDEFMDSQYEDSYTDMDEEYGGDVTG